MDFQKREVLIRALTVIGAGLVIVGAVLVPNLILAAAPFVARKGKSKKKDIYEALRYARRRKWIDIQETPHGLKLSVTTRGKRRWREISLIRPLPQDNWDGQWRIVIFDIPDRLKKTRDTVRSVLRRLNFIQLQESVWVSPWPCQDHVTTIKKLLDVDPYLKLIIATQIERQGELVDKFGLSTAR